MKIKNISGIAKCHLLVWGGTGHTWLLTIVLEFYIVEESSLIKGESMLLALFKIGRINLASKRDHSSADISQIKEMERHSLRKYFGENQRSMKCTVGLQINK